MELLERDALESRLDRLLEEARTGPAKLVFLGGEAGVGKTSLLRHFVQVQSDQVTAAVGACDPLSTPRPLLPIRDMAENLGPEVCACLSEERPREQLFEAIRGSLAAPDEVHVVIVEDAHWADAATLDLVRYLARRLDRISGLLIVSYRDDQIGPEHPLRVTMGDLATCSGLQRMVVPRLSPEAVATLARHSGFNVADLYQRTGGNPFFVTAVLEAGDPGIPDTIRDTVLARLARLAEPARRAIEACAILGLRIDRLVLDAVEPVAADDLVACVAHGLLEWHADSVHFRHALVSEAICDTMAPDRSKSLHRAALAALAHRESKDASRLAHHAERAGDGAAVVRFAPLAAQQAARAKSHREAASQYARALRYTQNLADRQRAELLDQLGWEYYVVDQVEGSIDARRRAIALWRELEDEAAEGDSLRCLSRSLWVAGRNEEAQQACNQAITLLERHQPGHALGMAYSNQAQLHMLALDLDQTIAWGNKAIALAECLGDDRVLAHALNNVGSARLVSGDEQGRRDLEHSLALAEKEGSEDFVARAYTNLGSCYCERYRFLDALHYLDLGIAYCRQRDFDYLGVYMQAYRAQALIFLGRWEEASVVAADALRNPSSAPVNRIMAGVALGRVRSRRGDPDVWQALDNALELAKKTGDLQRLAPVRRARAEAAWLSGDADRAVAEARADYQLALDRDHPWFLGELAYWRWKAGDLDAAPAGCAKPYALQIQGDALGAAREWEELGCLYEAAWARLESGAEDEPRVAHEAFTQLDAKPAAKLAATRLQQLGFGAAARGPRESTRANPAGLTACQFAVLKLLVQGMSNAEMADSLHRSTRTVDHHVAAILAKLEVRSRTEATRLALERGLVAPEDAGRKHEL